MTFCTSISPVLEQNLWLICVFHTWNDKVLKGFDNGLLTGMILIDLQKLFNTINHNMILEKLKAIGFCDNIVNFFHSYLTGRAFLVSIEKYSSISKISCGLPKGSILVLLLFWYVSMIWTSCVIRPITICRWLLPCLSIKHVNKI